MVAKMTARTGVHGSNKNEISRVCEPMMNAGDRDGFIFKRTAEGFEDGAREFGEFV